MPEVKQIPKLPIGNEVKNVPKLPAVNEVKNIPTIPTINFVVTSKMKPGTFVKVKVGDNFHKIKIPVGAKPGQNIRFQVPGTNPRGTAM